MRRSNASWFLLTSRMKGDTAIALMTIRLSSPAGYGSGRKTSINKNNHRSIWRTRISHGDADSSARAAPPQDFHITRYPGLVLCLGKLVTSPQRRRPREAETGAHQPRKQD